MELVDNPTNPGLHAQACSPVLQIESRCVVLKIAESRRSLAKPLRVGDGAVKLVTRFVGFELASLRSPQRFCQKRRDLGRAHRLKSACGAESLLKDLKRIAPSDDNTGREIHGVVQTLYRGSGLASENDFIAHWFHAQNSDALLAQHRQDLLFETVEVGVHYVERHLNSIEPEAVL